MVHLNFHPPKWFYSVFLLIFGLIAAVSVSDIIIENSMLKEVESSLNGVVKIQAKKSVMGIPSNMVGSGFFIGDNLIVTNNHVVDGLADITLSVRNSSSTYSIDIVASDKLSDVAVIKISDKDIVRFRESYTPKIFELEKSDSLILGETVYSIGHPWGFAWTVSQGIISGLDRRYAGLDTPTYYIQTDAKIYGGNSGGPLIDESGNVVGMNTRIYVETGGSFGFAIPGELLDKVLVDLIVNKAVNWPTLGVSVEPNNEGLEITGTTLESRMLKIGDVILEANGNRMIFPGDLTNFLAIQKVGDTITLLVKRDKETLSINAVLDGKPSSEYL